MVLRRACVPIGFSLNSPQTCLSFTEILFRKLKIHTLLQTHTDLTFMCMFYAVDLSLCAAVTSCHVTPTFRRKTQATELSLSGQRSQSNYERGQAFCQSESLLTLIVDLPRSQISTRNLVFNFTISNLNRRQSVRES